jgi:hypothetical protein
MVIYYYSPLNNNRPSWGVGIIHYHVWLLNKSGFSAYVIYDETNSKLTWLNLNIPVLSISAFSNLEKSPSDVLVLPEVSAGKTEFLNIACRKFVFVQNVFYIIEGIKPAKTYDNLGFEGVIFIMTHMYTILNHLTSLPLYKIPPFIAPYFFKGQPCHKRKKRILLYPKFNDKEYNILKHLLNIQLGITPKSRIKKILTNSEWNLIEMQNLNHEEVSREMSQAAFFISLNTTEAFNTSVPEAMASGCINLCFDGFGPLDFLEDKKNAFVFRNNHIYELFDQLNYLVKNYDNLKRQLDEMRNSAWVTANEFTIEKTKNDLLEFLNQLNFNKN